MNKKKSSVVNRRLNNLKLNRPKSKIDLANERTISIRVLLNTRQMVFFKSDL